ncbi:MAG: class I SAM-dependent methyltransferase [Desulfohalobiaceae bacterium]
MQRETRRRLVARAEFEDARVLEVGCGSGRVTAMYADMPRLIIGLEPDPGQVRAAARCVPAAHFVRASGTDLPFGRGVFEVVLFTLSLHHHPDPLTALRQAGRSLAPQGRILVLEPSPQSQIQQLCRVFEDEDDRLETVERVVHTSWLPVLSQEVFQTEWRFEDFEEVVDYAFSYYDHPADPDKRRAMRDFLGPQAEQRPLIMTDTLRLTCLSGQG